MPTAFVLSGGGAKGDFQVGAVHFLYDMGIRPDIICGSSVGAINGAKLAEGEVGANQGLQGLLAIWSQLQTDSDMYAEQPWLNRIPPSMKDYLTGKRDNLHFRPPPSQEDYYPWGTELGDLIYKINSLNWLANTGQEILKALDELSAAVSVYNLDPLAKKMLVALDQSKIAAWASSGKKLRLAVVGLESGALRFIDESGNVLERNGSQVYADQLAQPCQTILASIDQHKLYRQTLQVDLASAATGNKPGLVGQIRAETKTIGQLTRNLQDCIAKNPKQAPVRVQIAYGVLASAAIAGVFPPVRFGGETYVDGGFRDVVPIQAAIDLGADTIYCIVCSKPGVESKPFDYYSHASALELVARALAGITVNEVQESDIHPVGGWGQKNVRVIQPTIEIHDLLTIDPGLIRISMDYGYMRAGDVFNGAQPGDARWKNTDSIAGLRREIWRTECWYQGQPVLTDSTTPDGPPDTNQKSVIDGYKSQVQKLLQERQQLSGVVPGNSNEWYQNWELHRWQPSPTPWAVPQQPQPAPNPCPQILAEISQLQQDIAGLQTAIANLTPPADPAEQRQLARLKVQLGNAQQLLASKQTAKATHGC